MAAELKCKSCREPDHVHRELGESLLYSSEFLYFRKTESFSRV
jgi:hypothetical protein